MDTDGLSEIVTDTNIEHRSFNVNMNRVFGDVHCDKDHVNH